MIASVDILTVACWLFVCIVSVGMMGMFAGLELGTYVMNKFRIELHAEAKNRSAMRIRRLTANPDRLLSNLLIGTNINAYLSTFSISAIFIAFGHAEEAELYTLAVATPLLFVFSDSVPKNVYRRQAEQLVYRYSIVLHVSDKIFYATGLSQLVQFMSKALIKLLGKRAQTDSHIGHEGVKAVLAEGTASGALTMNQANIAGRIMSIADVHVGSVMQPMKSVIRCHKDTSRDDFIELIKPHNFSRIPLQNEENQVVGIVDIYDVLVDEKLQAPSANMIPPITVPAGATITDALYTLQRARRSMAIAVNPDGMHIGIFTVKDLVEEIVGEIEEW